jgi:hypothetical protein
MKKSKSSEDTLKAIRRNTAYTNSRILSLIYCVLLVGIIGVLVFIGTHDEANQMPSSQRIAWMFGGILAGVAACACLCHYLFAHYDQADALLQVAKFQERSIRTRKDAVDLVDKIREEVSKSESTSEEPHAKDGSSNETNEEDSIPPTPESEKERTPISLAPKQSSKGAKETENE